MDLESGPPIDEQSVPQLLELADPTALPSEEEIREAATAIFPTLEEKPVAGDGNCLFRAIAAQLPGGESRHADLRKEAVRFVGSHGELYVPR